MADDDHGHALRSRPTPTDQYASSPWRGSSRRVGKTNQGVIDWQLTATTMISVHQFRGICFTRIGQRRLMSATNYIIFDGANNFQSQPSIIQCTFHLQYSPEKKTVRHASTRFSSFRRVEGQHTCRRHQENRRHFSTFTKSEYIHPLSQIVLEHLQSHHSRWVTEMGLDTGLKLNKDGTFVLCFPGAGFGGFATNNDKGSVEESSAEGVPSPSNGSIWWVLRLFLNKIWRNYVRHLDATTTNSTTQN